LKCTLSRVELPPFGINVSDYCPRNREPGDYVDVTRYDTPLKFPDDDILFRYVHCKESKIYRTLECVEDSWKSHGVCIPRNCSGCVRARGSISPVSHSARHVYRRNYRPPPDPPPRGRGEFVNFALPTLATLGAAFR